MNRRMLTSLALVVLIVIAGAGAFWFFRAALTPAAPQQVAQTQHDSVPRSEEAPFSTQRALSMVSNQARTTLLPWGIVLDPAHGFIWVAEPGCEPKPKCPTRSQGVLGQYAFSDGNFIQDFNEPAGYTGPLFLKVDGAGNVWFTEPTSDAIGEFSPQSGSWNQWSLKKGSSPFDLVFDARGNLWFTEFSSNDIGFLNTNTHQVVETPIPTPGSNPYGMTITPQGTIWFCENAAGIDQIGSFTPTQSGTIKIKEYGVGSFRPHLIASDGAGNIWYSGGFNGAIGEFDPRTGKNTSYVAYTGACLTPPNCTGTHISGIYVDSKGNIWFTDSLSLRVGYIVPSTGQMVARTIHATNAHPNDGLVVDGSGRVWFTEEYRQTLTMWPPGTVS